MKPIAAPIFLAVSLLSAFTLQVHAQGGVPLWTNYYSGPGGIYYDAGYAIAVDSSGNVFVTGGAGVYYDAGTVITAFATIKYSGGGVPQWTNVYKGRYGPDVPIAIAVDRSGNAFVTGFAGDTGPPQYTTIKYSWAGMPLWTNRYLGPGNDASPSAVVVDGSSNVIVTGGSVGTGGNTDYATIKYSNAGLPLWTNRYNGPANGDDSADAIAVDASANVFVTGYSWSGSSYDYAAIKYSGAGAPLWTNRYNGYNGDHWGHTVVKVAVDSSGNILVAGTSTGGGGNFDYATIKYSNAGVPLWTNRYDGPGNTNDFAEAIALDSSGNVFVAGYSEGTDGTYFDNDLVTIKYSSPGVPLWTNTYNAPGSGYDSVWGLAVDSSGNVIITGSGTVAYSSAGVPLWTNWGSGNAIAVDRSDSLFTTGSGENLVAGGGWDFMTVKYSAIPPSLFFRKLDNELVLSWTRAGFGLQAAPVVTGNFTNIPAATSPHTNLITTSPQFFRLKAN